MNVYSWPYHSTHSLFESDNLEECVAFILGQRRALRPWMWVETADCEILYQGADDLRKEKAEERAAELPEDVVTIVPEVPLKKTRKPRKPKEVRDHGHIDAVSAAILDCKHAYYCEGNPLLSDEEFDKIEAELRTLDPENRALGVGCVLCGEKAHQEIVPPAAAPAANGPAAVGQVPVTKA